MRSLQFLICAILMTYACPLAAQQVVTSAGEDFSNNDTQLTWTLGELAIESLTQGDFLLTQGQQQPTIDITAGIEDNDLNMPDRLACSHRGRLDKTF